MWMMGWGCKQETDARQLPAAEQCLRLLHVPALLPPHPCPPPSCNYYQLRWVKQSLQSVRYHAWKAGRRAAQGGRARDALQHQVGIGLSWQWGVGGVGLREEVLLPAATCATAPARLVCIQPSYLCRLPNSLPCPPTDGPPGGQRVAVCQ